MNYDMRIFVYGQNDTFWLTGQKPFLKYSTSRGPFHTFVTGSAIVYVNTYPSGGHNLFFEERNFFSCWAQIICTFEL